MDSDEVVESEEEEKPKGRQTGRPPLQGKKPVKRRKLSDDDYDEVNIF